VDEGQWPWKRPGFGNVSDLWTLTFGYRMPFIDRLLALATSDTVRPVPLPDGGVAQIRTLSIRFAAAVPGKLADGVLKSTYTSKPLVMSVTGEPVFGEFAILSALRSDGWDGVWVDTFHGGKLWNQMPHVSQPVTLPAVAARQYQAIVAANDGKRSGFFDVFAWNGSEFLFVEYKGPGDSSNKNEAVWIAAARRAGISDAQLLFVA
jgi:hypothetical protein